MIENREGERENLLVSFETERQTRFLFLFLVRNVLLLFTISKNFCKLLGILKRGSNRTKTWKPISKYGIRVGLIRQRLELPLRSFQVGEPTQRSQRSDRDFYVLSQPRRMTNCPAQSPREVERGAREGGREIYDKATLILIHGTPSSFEEEEQQGRGRGGKKGFTLLLPRRRLLPSSTTGKSKTSQELEGWGGGGRQVGVGSGALEGCLSPPPCGGGLPFEVDIN